MHLRHLLPVFALACLAACAGPGDVEVGPYTVSVIGKDVYHIQDCNSLNPAGEAFDAEGNKTHFNNCSDIYLLVGSEKALLIDLSNPVTWADDAAESLRKIVWERAGGKPLTITFTHNHGDHTGMLPAFAADPGVEFALPREDFARLTDRFPEGRRRLYGEAEVFDLGGMTVLSLAVPGHTPGSTVFLLREQNLLFTGDAIGSGHGVWIFNAEGFESYASAVPRLLEWLEDPAVCLNPQALKIYGGHYWQRDWLNLPKGGELGIGYIREMKQLIDGIESGAAASEPSRLGRPDLDTYFRLGNAIIVWNAAQAEQFRKLYAEPFVCRDPYVVFRRIDDHTWEGNGHQVYHESVYLLEGEDRALLIDAGTYMPDLDRVVATLTDKPVMVALTHGHGDHVGGIGCFPEVWIHPEDEPMITRGRNPYEGTVHPLQDGDVIDLGGRRIEVMHTPGHTPGSVTFFDRERRYGFSGDAFGSTNLLLFSGTLRGLIGTNTRALSFMQEQGITQLYPGHYHGDNPETVQRLQDEIRMAREVLSGKRKGQVNEGNPQLNRFVHDNGVYIRYRDPEGLK